MDVNPSDDSDGEIDVGKIMATIRERISHKNLSRELMDGFESSAVPMQGYRKGGDFSGMDISDLSFISSNYDIHNRSYFISSHHPFLGMFLVKGRELVHGEIHRYTDPIISRQTDFNAELVRILEKYFFTFESLKQQIENGKSSLDRIKEDIDIGFQHIRDDVELRANEQKDLLDRSLGEAKRELSARIESIASDHQERFVRIDSQSRAYIDDQMRKIFLKVDDDIRKKAWLAGLLDDRINKGFSGAIDPGKNPTINYFEFEKIFRGSREEILEKQKEFVSYFNGCSRVLDIGCGRGEFLELLRDNGVGGIGVDIDPDMARYCRSRGLGVEQTDALTFLRKQEDQSLDGIFISQVVEHLEPLYLVALLNECFIKMKYDSRILIETVNPLSFVSFSNFYLDLTHWKPLHPETMKFLLISARFKDVDIRFVSDIAGDSKLKKIKTPSEMPDMTYEFVQTYNQNIDMLNLVLWGPMDYAAVGKK
jgi:SAM-dependent methyltransferase